MKCMSGFIETHFICSAGQVRSPPLIGVVFPATNGTNIIFVNIRLSANRTTAFICCAQIRRSIIPTPSCCLKCGTNYRLSFSIVAGMPLLVDSYSFSDICYKVKYVSKAQKKPSSKLHIIQKIVNILLGITTILKVIHDMLKG